MQNFLEQRHSKAMQELQDEMTAELEKSKNDLNSEMELELKKELEVFTFYQFFPLCPSTGIFNISNLSLKSCELIILWH